MNDNDAWRQLMVNSQIQRAPAQLDTTFYIGWRPGVTAPYGDGLFEGVGDQCDPEGWTANDVTAQLDNYWHVDDFSGLSGVNGGLVPLEGLQSMWCGARPDNTHPIKCSYINLPGYANAWNQSLVSDVMTTATGDVNLSFQIFWNSENEYDFTFIQWDQDDDNWQDLAVNVSPVGPGLDGVGQWDTTLTVPAASHSGTVRFRFLFQSDGAWSDGDGGGNTDGGCTIDMIQVTDDNGDLLALEDCEDEAIGDHNLDNWTSTLAAGYGELAALFQGIGGEAPIVQEDPCFLNETCVWAFINGSTANYGCGTPPHPEQAAVPYENARGQYVDQQIWSPWIDIQNESGTVFEMTYWNYWDLDLPAWILSDFHVRGIDSTAAIPCPSNWFGDGFVNYGGDKTWGNNIRPIGLIVPSGSTHIQVSLDVVDYCQYGFPCASSCHSHAPVYDNVSVYRVGAEGPQWDVRDIDQFQDNFPAVEPDPNAGTARADMASDNNWPEETQAIVPGDSAVVQVSDPAVGLANTTNSRAHVFFWASFDGPSSAAITADPTVVLCDARYNYVTTEAIAGRTWQKYQADTCYTVDGLVAPDDYNMDFCDNYFVPGDTIWFFWGAENNNGLYTYAAASLTTPGSQTLDKDEAATYADEFQILPARGGNGGDILYVDGMNFRGAQPYFDSSFQNLGILGDVDRYDIRGPSSGISNHPGARVKDATSQLVGIYRKILWNCGNLNTAFADGTGDNTDKSPDTQLLLAYMNNLDVTGGVYLDGDEVAYEWDAMADPSAGSLRNVYMNFGTVINDHQPTVGFNPLGVGVASGAFSEGTAPNTVEDTVVVEGGCPTPNTFDIIPATGASVVQMNYQDPRPGGASAPAILSQTTTNTVSVDVSFMLSGFSFHYIRDYPDGLLGYPARYRHMRHILGFLSNIVDEPTGGGDIAAKRNNLDQNIPNPFNPTTTIKYEVREAGLVSLKIYNVAGQLVKTLVDGQKVAGQVYSATWNGLNDAGQPVSSGVYFYKLVAKNFTQTKKMVLLK
jgi:hypothetical protein